MSRHSPKEVERIKRVAAKMPAASKHAMVVRDGFKVPLIGIPEEAVLEECDCCHETISMTQSHWTGTQMLCAKCNSKPDA